METKASAKYVRMSAQKARLVVDLIRGKDVADAQQILDYSPKASARVVSKILNSAIANAEHNNRLEPDDLFVSKAYVDEGPTLKRFRPRALGRATRINKRTSHITLVLDEREPRPEAKRRRLRRRVKPKPAEAESLQEELEEEEFEERADEELDVAEAADTELEEEAPEAAAEPQQDLDTEAELNAEAEDKEGAEEAAAAREDLDADKPDEESESED